jgi:hypothetical protein
MTYKEAMLICKDDEDIITVCSGCHYPVRHIGEDGIDYCDQCETIVEGSTEYLPESQVP